LIRGFKATEMSNKSLAYRVSLFISGAVLIVFALFIFGMLRFQITNAKKSEENKADSLKSEIYRNISDKVFLTQFLASDIAQQFDFYHTHKAVSKLLKPVLEKKEFEFIESIEIRLSNSKNNREDSIFVVTREDGKVVFHSACKPDRFSINEDTLRNYLHDLTKSGWSEPFKYYREGIVVSVLNFGIESQNTAENSMIEGFVRCVVSIDYFQELISKTKIWKTGYAFLVSPKGIYMTYPRSEYILKRNIRSAFADKWVKDSILLEKFIRAESGAIEVRPPPLNYKRGWSYPTLIKENNWLLVFTVPFNELHEDLFNMLIKMAIILFIVVVAIFILVFSIARKVMQPLSKVSREFHKFSIEIDNQNSFSNNETITLRESLTNLQKEYERYKIREEEERKRGKKYLADMALASEIQQSIIPAPGNYSFRNVNLHLVYEPAHFISGDLTEFFMVDDNKLLFTIGDVSGVGIPAALFMGIAHTYIRSNASFNSAKNIVIQVNKQLCQNNSNQFFLTLFLGILDIEKEVLNYCNAGHTPTFLQTSSGNVKELGDPHGIPLGLYPDRNYKDSVISISKGDTIILYTDGVTDHMNGKGEFFGVDSFYKLFNQMKDLSPEEAAGLIKKSLADFGKGSIQHDDLSLMILKYN
jgi:phosphoserine phosphatase RsbU/P